MIAVTSQSFLKNQSLMDSLRSIVETDRLILAPIGPILAGEDLYELLKPAEAVLCGRELLDDKLLKRLPNLKFISKYGVGLDNLDLDFISKNNIHLHFQAGVNSAYVAEQSLGFMIGALRNLVSSMQSLKQGNWVKNGGQSLFHKTVGIVGCGNVGKDLIRLLKPFSCRILIFDIVGMPEYCAQEGVEQVELDFLLKNADIVSLHVPLTVETKRMITGKELGLMKESSILINTCRGSVVEESDLKDALRAKNIRFCCSDVFELEPLVDESLYSIDNFWPTPHIAGNAVEAIQEMGHAAIDGIKVYLEGCKNDT